VELAVCIPLLTVILLLLVQVGIVAIDQVAVTQAAREGARAAAVDPAPGAAVAAARKATGLDPARLAIESGRWPGGEAMVTVKARYRSQVIFPLTGAVLLQPDLVATASMRVEN